MIYLTVIKTKKLLQDATLNVVWHPSDDAIRELAYHSHTFPFGTPDSEIAIHETTVAIPGIVSAINSYLGQELYTSIMPLNSVIDNALLSAIDFGAKVMTQFKRENVLLGISYTDKIPYVQGFLHNLLHMLESGSAKEAINELDRLIAAPDTVSVVYDKKNIDGSITQTSYTKLQLAPFITNVRLTAFKNQLQDFYGIPRT